MHLLSGAPWSGGLIRQVISLTAPMVRGSNLDEGNYFYRKILQKNYKKLSRHLFLLLQNCLSPLSSLSYLQKGKCTMNDDDDDDDARKEERRRKLREKKPSIIKPCREKKNMCICLTNLVKRMDQKLAKLK